MAFQEGKDRPIGGEPGNHSWERGANAMTTRCGGQRKRNLDQYDHQDKQRLNKPPVGLVTPKTDPDTGSKKTNSYDPHLDPQLAWAGKAEHTSFEIPTVTLHVHERIELLTVNDAGRRRNGDPSAHRPSFFEMPQQNRLIGNPSLAGGGIGPWQ